MNFALMLWLYGYEQAEALSIPATTRIPPCFKPRDRPPVPQNRSIAAILFLLPMRGIITFKVGKSPIPKAAA